jgi:DNA-binding MarR family transcriptional regulator
MSNILSLMEKNGLITRAPSKKDGRAKQITLTPRAVAIDRFVRQDIERLEAVITKNISEEELKCFFSTIDKIKNNLEVQDD